MRRLVNRGEEKTAGEVGWRKEDRRVREVRELDGDDGVLRGGEHVPTAAFAAKPSVPLKWIALLEPGQCFVENGGDAVLVSHADEGSESAELYRKDLVVLVVVAFGHRQVRFKVVSGGI